MPIQNEKSNIVGQCVYIVSCYQNLVGCYASFEDATQVAKTFIDKGRICDISCQIIK